MPKTNWFEQAFGAAIDEVGAAISDVRSKLIDEAWFGRRTPEQQHKDLGWSQGDHPDPGHSQQSDHDIER